MPLDLSGLQRIRAGLDAAIEDGTKAGAEMIEELASQLAPKDTGALSESGDVQPTGKGTYTVSFGNGLPDIRAVVQEYGSIYQSAQPYLVPASQQIDVQAEIAARIKDLIG